MLVLGHSESEFLSVYLSRFLTFKVMKIFGTFSQPYGLVRKQNQPVHFVRFSETAVWVLCFVCIGSWSFGVGIALCLFY